MFGVLTVIFFLFTALFAAVVLTDSVVRGVRAYRELTQRAAASDQYYSIMVKVADHQRWFDQPSVRMRFAPDPSIHRIGGRQFARVQTRRFSAAA